MPESAKIPRHSVTAVFVTMNRRETVLTCLRKLAEQTSRPGALLIVNNASTDGTLEAIEGWAREHSDFPVRTITLEENLGNAGGMEIIVETAFREGAGYAWILDDDSWPEPLALERLLAADLPENSLRSSKVIDLATGALSWPVQVSTASGWQLCEGHDPLPSEPVVKIRRSWLGALVPRKIYETVGPIEGRLFLRGEDEDYPRRIENANFPVFLVTDSLLHHPPAGRLMRCEFFGKMILLEGGLSGDKLYYRLRNSFWISLKDRGKLETLLCVVMYGITLLRYKSSKLQRIKIWWEALSDAYAGKLGARTSVTKVKN